MKSIPSLSTPFRRICGANHIKISADDNNVYANLSFLNLFLSRELTVSLNNGELWEGVLTGVDADGIRIGDIRRGAEEWSAWLHNCQLAMLTGAQLDLELIRVTDAASYGVDASAERCVALGAKELEKLRSFLVPNSANSAEMDYPLLYRESPENGMDVLSVGNSVPKTYFGRIQKYVPDFGAGQIVPFRYGEILRNEKIRFIAEDLVNILPRELDTSSYVYDVSYTVGLWQTRAQKAENIYLCRKVSLQPEQAVNTDLNATAELARQSGAVPEILDLPALSSGGQYGLIYYYRPFYNHYVKIGNLFKNPAFLSDWTEEHTGAERSEKLPAFSDDALKDERDAQVNTLENVYLVSYVPYGDIGQVVVRETYSKRNLWMLRAEGNQLLIVRSQQAPPVPEPEPDEATIEELFQRKDVNAHFLTPPPLEEGERYGFLFYYKPEFPYLRVSNLFVNKALISTALHSQLGNPTERQIPNDAPSRLRDPDGGALNTQAKAYLVAYFPDFPNRGVRILEAYERRSVSALLAWNDKALMIAPQYADKPAQSDAETIRLEQDGTVNETLTDNRTQDECEIIELPPLPDDGSQYALINRYGRSYPLLYFYRAVANDASGEQKRIWTLARADPHAIQFYENESSQPVTPDAAFNTLKYAYVVRIIPESVPLGNGAPYVQKPVMKIREFAHSMYSRIEVDGATLRVYGYKGGGIVRSGLAPDETVPPFAEGETLILSDGRNARAEVCPGESFQPEEGVSVYRFGVLTGLLRSMETSTIIGGFLNGDVYFPIDEMNDQTRNIVLTARKRMLLLYTRANGHWAVSRVLPDDILDIPWKKGTVTECGVSAAEIFIDTDTRDETGAVVSVRHYQSTETDGYVSNAARNGYLKGETVFLKEVVCPWSADGQRRLSSVAAVLHCEREKALVRYSEMQDTYFAYRYNLKTGRIGAVKIPLYGPQSALSAVENQPTEILFAPIEANRQRLYASLPDAPIKEEELAHYLTPSSGNEGQTGAQTRTVTRQRAGGAEKLPMGQFLLQLAEHEELFRALRDYLRGLRLSATERDDEKEKLLYGVFSSEEWSDNAIAAALLTPQTYREFLRPYCQGVAPSANAYLRRAFRGRILELITSGDYRNGELIANWTPILETVSNWTQRARDLYLYLLPCFDRRWKIPELVRQNILRGSFASDGEEMENQEFMKALRDLLKNQESQSEKTLKNQALRLLPQLLALDANSLSFFRDHFADAIPLKLADALWSSMEIPAATLEGFTKTERIFQELEERRARFAEQTENILHELSLKLDSEDTICGALSQWGRRDDFNAFARNLDKDDQNNICKFIRICDAVTNQAGKDAASALRSLENAEKLVRTFREQIAKHPTRIAIGLFYGDDRDIPEEIHREIVEAVRAICENPDTLPEIECYCNVDSIQPGQNSFTLNLLNGKIDDLTRRELQDVVVSIRPVSPDADSAEPRPYWKRAVFPILPSGKLRSVDIPLTEARAGDEIRIECAIEYQYLASAEYDENSCQYRPRMERVFKNQELTLQVETETVNKIGIANPYKRWEKKTMAINSGMFFGREKEENEALDFLMGKDRRRLIPGQTLLIYGQKRCGKSSFLGKLRAQIPAHDIVLEYEDIFDAVCQNNPVNLPHFTTRFHCNLLRDFLDKLPESRPDLTKLAGEYKAARTRIEESIQQMKRTLEEGQQLEVRLFEDLIRDFRKNNGGKSRIVLIMDEFTRLCASIRDNHPELSSMLNFIRTFTSKNWEFVQIIVGHNSMKRILEDLNIVNSTMETSHVMRLSALDEESAREMIQNPMQEACQYNPYETPSGQEAVKLLMELSGRYPNYIIFLCDHLFRYYKSLRDKQMDAPHIDKMLKRLLDEKRYVGAPYYDMDRFEPILREDDDDDQRREDIREYLRFIALKTCDSPEHECHKDAVCDKIGKSTSYAVRELLLSRKVLRLNKDKIRIDVGLFRDFVSRTREE